VANRDIACYGGRQRVMQSGSRWRRWFSRERYCSIADQFVDGAWELRVDRAWPSTGGHPSVQLVENDYRPVSGGPTYPILVSDRGSKVTIGKAPEASLMLHFPLAGSRTSATRPIGYALNEGTFAGGRFLVWSGERTLQAELTIYGSGVPIVSSERGSLARRP